MGSGGGGQSGKVSYPAYLETAHSEYLDDAGVDVLGTTTNVATAIEAAITANPYDVAVNTGAAAYDPTDRLTSMDNAVSSFDEEVDYSSNLVAALSVIDSKLINSQFIEEDIKAYRDQMDDMLTSVVLPRFRGGMRDINAVTSGAFAIGEAYIEASSQRDVAKYARELKMKLNLQRNELATKSAESMLSYAINFTQYKIEVERIGIVAGKEQNDFQIEIEDAEAKWDLEMLAYMGNAIAAISGAAGAKMDSKPSAARSAIGGALAGGAVGGYMAAGTAMGGPVGAVLGAGLGALLGGVL